MTLDYLQTMSSQGSDNSSPTELVLVNGDKGGRSGECWTFGGKRGGD